MSQQIESVKMALQELGINASGEFYYNPDYDLLIAHETSPELTGAARGVMTDSGAVAVDTGIFTGRSPRDKYIVRDEQTRDTVWWADSGLGRNDNKPLSPDVWRSLKSLVAGQLSGKKLYVIDAWCGASPDTRLGVRFVTEVAWQAHFVKNMFIVPSADELASFTPDFVVLNGAGCTNANWQAQGMNSENFVAFNLSERIQLIGGTWYGGEMKKGLFSVMNYLLPQKGIASMHCSANRGEAGDVALFFGLSGTGKTTLSTDPHRQLIGDDEHGWDDDGVFNFEGGCYAKTINLDPQAEPEIYGAIRRNALLENVVVRADGSVDYADGSKTENTRVSYPLSHIDNIVKPVSRAGHPSKVIFLAADAFGVLPPVSRLTTEQMQYHFLSGFTSKLAGTERGITQPTPTFSACYGAAFLLLHPTQYASVLAAKMAESGAEAWLVNTGWNGEGKRLSLRDTRSIISAILNGTTGPLREETIPVFGLAIPQSIPGVDSAVLDPRNGWSSADNGRRRPRAWLSCLWITSSSTAIPKRARVWRWPVRSCRRARSKPDPRPAGRRLAPTCWRAALLRKGPQRISREAITHPLILRLRANAQIEINRRLVPVEHAPLQTPALTLYSILRDGFQQRFSGADPAIVGGDVQILHIDTIASKPGGVAGEEHRVAHRFARHLADQRFGFAAAGKQSLSDLLWRRHYLLGGFLVDREFINHVVDSGGVVRGGLADCDAHGVSCIHSQKRAKLLTLRISGIVKRIKCNEISKR